MLKRIFLLIALFTSVAAGAQSIRVDDELLRGEFNMNAGINTDGYQLEAGVAYFPGDCFGLRFTFGIDGEIGAFDDCDCWCNNNSYAIRARFTPALVFRTPRIIRFRSPDSGLNLFVEPGVTFSPGASESKDPRTVCWDVKCGINLQFGIGFFTIGYEATNFALYSGRPYSYYKQPDNVDHNTHAAYVGFGIKF